MTLQTSLFAAEPVATQPSTAAPQRHRAPKHRASSPAAVEGEARYWVGVVCAEHVARGVAGGYAQLCHGKAAPLKRMRGGDWLLYYSPAERMGGGEPVQAFTAIGRVSDGAPYEHDMGGGFVPYRRDVRYLPCSPAPIRPLIAELSFLPDKSRWGYAFRFGNLAIPREDFVRIARAMGVDPDAVDTSQDDARRGDVAGEVPADG
jgi:hypothetical protein